MIKLGINALFMIPGEVGGSETLLMESVRALSGLPGAPAMILFANRENGPTLQSAFGGYPGITVRTSRLPATQRWMRIIYEQTILPCLARRHGVTVLWSPGYTAPLLYRAPQVLSVLDMQYRRHPEDLTWPARLATDMLIRMGVKRCRRVIAISEFSRAEINLFVRPSVPVDVVPLGVDQNFGTQPGQAAADETAAAAIGGRSAYILCVANTYPHKNVAALVKAFDKLQHSLPHRLVLVGKARRGESAVAAAIGAAQAGDRIVRLDHVKRPVLAALYRNADLFVFPSLYEGFGLPVLEAMVSGTPVLANRAAQAVMEITGETIDHVPTGSATELASAIPAILARPPGQRREMVERARLHAAAFTWRASAEKLLRSMRAAGSAPDGNGPAGDSVTYEGTTTA